MLCSFEHTCVLGKLGQRVVNGQTKPCSDSPLYLSNYSELMLINWLWL